MAIFKKLTIGGAEPAVLQEKTATATANGDVVLTPDENYDGLSKATVTVAVPETDPELQDKTVTANGSVTADEGYDGLGTVTVEVEPKLQAKTVEYTSNTTATITSSSYYDGLSSVAVTVAVPVYGGEHIQRSQGYTVTLTSEWVKGSSSNEVSFSLWFLDGTIENFASSSELSGTRANVIAVSSPDYLEFTENGIVKSVEGATYELVADITIDRILYASCIDINTLVTMADGTTKTLGSVEVGDEVLSIDYDTMKLVTRKVIYSGKNEPDYSNWYVNSYWENVYSDGTVINQAMKHRFYNLENQSYVYLNYWNVGEHTYKLDGTNPELVSRTLIQGKLNYGRITLEDSNNYFANGLSTGDRNCCPNKVILDHVLTK